MATRIAVRSLRQKNALHSFQPRRSFINLPGTEATVLRETRILPYSSKSLYKLIADVDSYSAFLPYCQESRVTKWSSEDENGKRWPAEADLKIGWGGYEETFSSRLFCVPNKVVEALGGDAQSTIPRAAVRHHSSTLDSPYTANDIFKSIATRWNVKSLVYDTSTRHAPAGNTAGSGPDRTEVDLTIEFQFANPIYAALSRAVAPKVAAVMIEAFEERARKLLDGPEGDVLGKGS